MEKGIQAGNSANYSDNALELQRNAAGRYNGNATTAPSSATNGRVRTGSAVVTHTSFQAFLAEEQATLQATAPNAGQPAQASQTAPAAPEKSTMPAKTLHIVQKGETIWELARERYRVDPEALMRCNNITNPGKLAVGRELRIPTGNIDVTGPAPDTKEVVASWYGRNHQGRRMANGKRFDMHASTIAHRDIPIGTKVELENPKTGQKAEAVVTDRGPFHPGRDVDLSLGLAKRLSLAKQGVGTLKMRVL